ncbi:MAG: LacI family transcriptional regulator, partial [Thermoleophilaceae bacterium]|nr:LacI family transcriptional regulator [Thermoleophilaceae bacterium]
DKVSSDNPSGGARVADHLLDLGHRRLALLEGPRHISTGRERAAGFIKALKKRGVDQDDSLHVSGDFSHEFGFRAMSELLTRKNPPTGVFCVNDAIAFGAIDAARAAGVAVPGQLSIVGYDDVEMSSWKAFELTTVRQPTAEMARLGVAALLERTKAPNRSYRHVRIQSELVVRQSTGLAP